MKFTCNSGSDLDFSAEEVIEALRMLQIMCDNSNCEECLCSGIDGKCRIKGNAPCDWVVRNTPQYSKVEVMGDQLCKNKELILILLLQLLVEYSTDK